MKAILLALETAGLIATPEQVRNALDTSDFADAHVLKASDMAMLFTKLSAEIGVNSTSFPAVADECETSGVSVATSAPNGASCEDDSVDVTVPLGMTLEDLEVAFPEKSWANMRSLPQRVKSLVVDQVNKLLFDSGQTAVVGLDQEDIMKWRQEKLAVALPDIIDNVVIQDQGLYITYGTGAKELVLDLAPLSSKQQEEFRVAWSTISEKRRQHVVAEAQKQFQVCVSEMEVAVDGDDMSLFRKNWMTEHLGGIIAANVDVKVELASDFEFPFDGPSWTEEVTGRAKIFLSQLSDSKKDSTLELMH